MIVSPVPLIGFAAWSGAGKTTLIKQILPLLKQKGIRVALIKHAHHQFEVDIPGKDSYELRKAGAATVLVCSKNRWAMMSDRDQPAEPDLQTELNRLDLSAFDLIIVEGFKDENFNKIEIHRAEVGKPLLYPNDPGIVALACKADLLSDCALPRLDMDQPDQIADWLLKHALSH